VTQTRRQQEKVWMGRRPFAARKKMSARTAMSPGESGDIAPKKKKRSRVLPVDRRERKEGSWEVSDPKRLKGPRLDDWGKGGEKTKNHQGNEDNRGSAIEKWETWPAVWTARFGIAHSEVERRQLNKNATNHIQQRKKKKRALTLFVYREGHRGDIVAFGKTVKWRRAVQKAEGKEA